jgi:hypothetical protein
LRKNQPFLTKSERNLLTAKIIPVEYLTATFLAIDLTDTAIAEMVAVTVTIIKVCWNAVYVPPKTIIKLRDAPIAPLTIAQTSPKTSDNMLAILSLLLISFIAIRAPLILRLAIELNGARSAYETDIATMSPRNAIINSKTIMVQQTKILSAWKSVSAASPIPNATTKVKSNINMNHPTGLFLRMA